jgi:hypothetical protein
MKYFQDVREKDIFAWLKSYVFINRKPVCNQKSIVSPCLLDRVGKGNTEAVLVILDKLLGEGA